MRAFLAVELDDASRDALAKLLRRLKRANARASWTRPENLHVTLRFLGDIAPAVLEEEAPRLAEAVAEHPAFTAAVRGVGAFPNSKRPRIVWAGMRAGDALMRLHEAAEAWAHSLGLEGDDKVFQPHVTLGRVREPRSERVIAKAIAPEAGFVGGEFPVGAVTLFSSTLGSGGPTYTKLAEFPLR